MYAIRVDPSLGLIHVALSGRVVTDEGLRAVSQAFTLAEAGGIAAACCDVTELRRGPGGMILLAAALSAGYRPGMRIALVAGESQARAARRLARFSGLREGVEVFDSAAAAQAWLAPALPGAALATATGRRHVQGSKAARRAGSTARAAEPAA